jgi:predicted TIM-barrel fold metal-dependent hydrolase
MASGIGRRTFIGTAAGAAALVSAWASRVSAQAGREGAGGRRRTRIDTHHHAWPAPYVAAMAAAGLNDQIAKAWTVEQTFGDMEKAGVETAVLSVTQPALAFADGPTARRVARASNEWTAQLVKDHPGRFGFFALVPMPDVDGTLAEIAYALDVLKADGIGFMTNYGDAWLGNARFAPVTDELHRRKAVAYTHPTLATCCGGLLPDVAPTIVEFGADTSRTIADIVFSGTAARCPDVRFIFSHGGGAVPFFRERFERALLNNPTLTSRVPNGALHELRRFYYDTAWVAHDGALAALAKLVPASQILFGSDYPYRTGEDHVKGLAAYGFGRADLQAIESGNARRLLPGLRR